MANTKKGKATNEVSKPLSMAAIAQRAAKATRSVLHANDKLEAMQIAIKKKKAVLEGKLGTYARKVKQIAERLEAAKTLNIVLQSDFTEFGKGVATLNLLTKEEIFASFQQPKKRMYDTIDPKNHGIINEYCELQTAQLFDEIKYFNEVAKLRGIKLPKVNREVIEAEQVEEPVTV